MIVSESAANSLDQRIAARLRSLRHERDWSLDELAGRCGVSRATLSRLENGEVSPTAAVLGKLCAAHALTMSRLMAMVEAEFAPLVSRDDQAVWTDPETRFRRRAVSPPAGALAGEVIEGELPPATRIAYDRPPRPGLEHHLLVLDGALDLTIDGSRYQLTSGDCLRYQLYDESIFETGADQRVRYLVFIV